MRGAKQGKVRREDMLATCQERRNNDSKPHGAGWVPWMDPDNPYFHRMTANLAEEAWATLPLVARLLGLPHM